MGAYLVIFHVFVLYQFDFGSENVPERDPAVVENGITEMQQIMVALERETVSHFTIFHPFRPIVPFSPHSIRRSTRELSSTSRQEERVRRHSMFINLPLLKVRVVFTDMIGYWLKLLLIVDVASFLAQTAQEQLSLTEC